MRYNICKNLRFRSSAKAMPHFQGTLQERINHPAAWCHKSVNLNLDQSLDATDGDRLPDSVSFDLGALVEPLGVAIHASRRAQLGKGSSILLLGAGAVGLLCAAMAKVFGANNVVIADIQKERVDFAVANGFAYKGYVVPSKRGHDAEESIQIAKEVAISMVKTNANDNNEDEGFDVVFECTGVEACTQAAIYVGLSIQRRSLTTNIHRRLALEAKS